MARATSSLPVPLSPRIRTVTSWPRDPADGLVHLLHRGRPADDPVGVGVGRLLLVVEQGRDVHQAASSRALASDVAELVEVDRLEQVLEGAPLHRLDGRLGRGERGDDDDRQPRVDPADLVEGVQARHVGQAHVEDHDVGPLPADQLDAPPGPCAR